MKKLLAVLLAAMLVLSMGVMAFADDITTDQGKAQSTLTTKLTDENGNPVAGFTVSIPATVDIPWGGTTGGDFINWSYSSKLEAGQRLSISLDKTGGNMVDTTGATTDVLAYTLGGPAVDMPFVTDGPVSPVTGMQVHIMVPSWDGIAVAAYSDTVTFTAEVI